MKRIVALALAGLLVFVFAACDSKDQETAGLEVATAFQQQTEPETTIALETEETTTEPASDDSPTGAGSTGEGTDLQAPTGKAEILALYNDALGKSSGLNKTLYSYDILVAMFVGVKLAGLKQDDMDMLDAINEPYRYYRDNQRKAHDLVKLTDAQVNSVVLKGQNGKLATYEMSLKPATAGQSMQNGYAGYSSLVTFPEIDTLLGLAAEGQSYKVSIYKFSLSNGKLAVTIDLESGAIQSAEISFTQDATGPLRITWYFIPGTADVVLKLAVKSTYKI